MAIQSPSSSSSFSYAFTYQVFLSFRGTDTRNGFTGNLYNALTKNGIHTFFDEIDLQRGDEITPSLVKAIEESRIFIPVFSPNYASSSFCLDELVQIIHCYKTKGRLVLPVFYDVDPSHVRHHRGSYGKALAKLEERFQNNMKNMERLHTWKLALTQAANLSGYHSSLGYEYKFIEKIVKYISNKISRQPLHVANYPVGLQSRVQQVKLLLDEGSDDGVRMVGIYGSGGLGKSTLARAIYNFVADQFEGLCFLHDVRENSAQNNLKHLQEKLLFKTTGSEIKLDHVSEGIPIIKERLSRKKILLILDDADNMEQLLALAGGLDWFGRGSRVIVTTRDKHLLTCHGIERTHAVKGLNGTEALELLRWMAFKNDEVPSSYEAILNRAVTYACGFPLAIVTIGSNLFGRSVENWELTLDEYEKIPNKEIQKILRVSYNALEEKEQSVFLDIACCFKGCKWTEVKQILHAHYGHPIEHHVAVLAEKSLVDHWEFDGNVTLHDLIEYMGKEVVRQESPYKPGERSRLWFHDDIFQVLKENTGTGNIEMIYLNPSMENVIEWNAKGFKKMTNLKTLIIENVHFARGPEYLPSSLRYLKWKGCPSKALSSCISTKEFNYMKVLTLDYCKYLTHIPNVSGLPNLEKFSFENCHSLLTIHNSVGYLNKLEILNAKNCIKLESFPPLRLPSLKELKLSHCSSLKSFPKLLCKMTNIKDIWLNHTSIGELPLSFENFSELRDLQIYQSGMFRFPKHNEKMNSIVFSNVKSLTLNTISLSDECLPILLKWFVNVKHLDLSQTNFKILPECLNECHLLRILNLDFCESLDEIRGLPPNLEEFSAIKCESLSFSSRRMLLKELNEAGCTKISLPNGRDGIPDWFEHQTRGNRISFWFRRKIPSITFIILSGMSTETDFRLLVNGFNLFLTGCIYDKYVVLPSEHTFLFDLELKRHIYENFENKPNMKETLKKNEWNQVELNWGKDDFYPSAQMGIHVVKEKSNTKEHDLSEDEIFMPDEIKKLSSAQIGIHEKSNTEEDVIFTNPYRTTTTTKPYYSQALFPNPIGKIRKFRPTLKKQRFVEVLKTENLRSLEETKLDGVKSLEVSETESLQQQDLALLSSGMQNMVLTDKKEKEQHD